MLHKPILFATPASQRCLVEIYQLGQTKGTHRWNYDKTGIVYRRSGRKRYALDPRHPQVDLIRSLLSWLCGDANAQESVDHEVSPEQAQRLAFERPLGHKGDTAFRVLLALARSHRLLFKTLWHQIGDCHYKGIQNCLGSLIRWGSVTESQLGYELNPVIPDEFRRLIIAMGEYAAERDPLYLPPKNHTAKRPLGYGKASDGAPRIFQTDLRLRCLMALAINGPLKQNELRRATGSEKVLHETEGRSPFTRAALVRQWQTDEGLITALDPQHPNAYALRRYLVAMEAAFPLSPLKQSRRSRPLPPMATSWQGDRTNLFGSPVVTKILVSIGVLDWTFQALCNRICTGYYREVVKDAVKRLEEDGILVGDRPRKAGANIRILKLAHDTPANPYLADLLRDVADTWPSFKSTVLASMDSFTPKTMAYMQNQEIWLGPIVVEKKSDRSTNRIDCIARYKGLVARHGRELTSRDLNTNGNSTLYRHIRRNWSTFAEFRAEAIVAPRFEKRESGEQERQRCIGDYEALSAKLGHAPNTSELVRIQPMLRERIVAEWGSFAEFVYQQNVSLSRHHRSPKLSDELKRERILEEYEILSKRLGLVPNTAHLKSHTDGLYKRILKSYGTFTKFRELLERS